MDLTIITVSYNVKEFLEQAINSIQKACKHIEYEIYVVDNASSDGSTELIRRNFPAVKLIANTENVGFARANNQALKQANGDFVLLINPDTIVQEDTFSVILDFFQRNPECGMAGCKILNPDGSLQLACRRSFPTPWIAFTKIIGLSKLFPGSKLFGKYNLTYLDPDKTYEVEAISGSFMFFRKKVIEDIGYLDESFFMYGEDLDWCFRIREAGWKIFYLPQTKIIHFKGESSKKSNKDLIMQFYIAMKLFVEKHYQHRYFHVPQWVLLVGIALRASLTFIMKFFVWALPGLFDFFLLNVSMVLGILIRFHNLNHLHSYLLVMIVYSSIWLSCLIVTGSYGQSKFSSLRTIYGVTVGLILITSLTYFFDQYDYSRAVVLIAGGLNILFLGGWRFILKILSRFQIFPFAKIFNKNLLGRRVLIVAPVSSGQKIASKLKSSLDTGYDVCGIVVPDEHVQHCEQTEAPVLGHVKYLDEFIRQANVHEIIFSTEQISYDYILGIVAKTKGRKIDFKLIPSSMDVVIGKASIDYIGDLPLMDIEYRLNRLSNIVIKRGFDIIVSFISLIVLLPEIFYIKLLKHANIVKKEIYTIDLNTVKVFEFSGNVSAFQRKMLCFWSILKGDLSLVGSELIVKNETSAHVGQIGLKPGLMGLAQLNRSSELSGADRERYNLYYLKNYSLLLDVEIIIKTLFKI